MSLKQVREQFNTLKAKSEVLAARVSDLVGERERLTKLLLDQGFSSFEELEAYVNENQARLDKEMAGVAKEGAGLLQEIEELLAAR